MVSILTFYCMQYLLYILSSCYWLSIKFYNFSMSSAPFGRFISTALHFSCYSTFLFLKFSFFQFFLNLTCNKPLEITDYFNKLVRNFLGLPSTLKYREYYFFFFNYYICLCQSLGFLDWPVQKQDRACFCHDWFPKECF